MERFKNALYAIDSTVGELLVAPDGSITSRDALKEMLRPQSFRPMERHGFAFYWGDTEQSDYALLRYAPVFMSFSTDTPPSLVRDAVMTSQQLTKPNWGRKRGQPIWPTRTTRTQP